MAEFQRGFSLEGNSSLKRRVGGKALIIIWIYEERRKLSDGLSSTPSTVLELFGGQGFLEVDGWSISTPHTCVTLQKATDLVIDTADELSS